MLQWFFWFVPTPFQWVCFHWENLYSYIRVLLRRKRNSCILLTWMRRNCFALFFVFLCYYTSRVPSREWSARNALRFTTRPEFAPVGEPASHRTESVRICIPPSNAGRTEYYAAAIAILVPANWYRTRRFDNAHVWCQIFDPAFSV